MVSDQSFTQIIEQSFEGLSDDSRVWIWQSDRELTLYETVAAVDNLRSFTNQWVSHNRALVAKSSIILNRFWVVVLDQSAGSGASGCSIDSLTHAIQNIAGSLGVNVLDRTQFCFYKNNEVISIGMGELSKALANNTVKKEELVFDNLIKTKQELSNSWLKPLNESWHKRFI